MTQKETTTYWHEKAKETESLTAKLRAQESHIKTLEGVLKDAQEALRGVCDLSFDEDLAKYGLDGKLTECASDAIAQYTEMATVCEKALARVDIAVGKDE